MATLSEIFYKYRGLGYDKYRTHTYTSDTTGMQVAKQYLCWTQLGRKFILDLVKKQNRSLKFNHAHVISLACAFTFTGHEV